MSELNNRTQQAATGSAVKSESSAVASLSASVQSNVALSSSQSSLSAAKSSGSAPETKLLDKRRIADLLKEVDPLEQLDEDVEELLAQIADDFIDNVVTSACQLARHRKSGTVEVKDVQLHLERHWNMWIPGFGSEDLRPYKKQATTEAHKQDRNVAAAPQQSDLAVRMCGNISDANCCKKDILKAWWF